MKGKANNPVVSGRPINRTKPVAPAPRTVVSHTPSRVPGASGQRSYNVGTPVQGGTRENQQGSNYGNPTAANTTKK
jgi:hypothetical protein